MGDLETIWTMTISHWCLIPDNFGALATRGCQQIPKSALAVHEHTSIGHALLGPLCHVHVRGRFMPLANGIKIGYEQA